jgi:ankyrin repeat protein
MTLWTRVMHVLGRNGAEEAELGELIEAVKLGDTPVIHDILMASRDLARYQDASGRSLLHMTQQADVAETMVINGVPTNLQDKDGLTPLHHAAKSGNEALLQQLIVGGADTTLTTFKGLTACDLARQNGHAHAVEILSGCVDDSYDLPDLPAEAGRN